MASSTPKTSTAKARAQRLRIPDALPRLPEQNSFPFARSRPELKFLSYGQLVRIVMETPEWEQHVGVLCDAIDAAMPPMSAARRLYTSRQLESIEVLRRVRGDEKLEQTRDWLAGDRGSGTRRLLAFDHPRDHVHDRYRPRQREQGDDRRRDGVPSEATLRRHVGRMGIANLAAHYEDAFESIVPAHLQEFPEMRQEARIQHTDGSGIRTHYTAPHYRKRADGSTELINAHRVTAPEAGSTGNSNKSEKNGDGWNLVTKGAVSGLALAYATSKWHEAENKTAEQQVHAQYRRIVAPYLQLGPGQLCVETGDNALHRHAYRRLAAEDCIVQNIHLAKHYSEEPSNAPHPDKDEERHSMKLDAMRTPVDGTGWNVNGHLEPVCRCGEGTVERKFRAENGRARVWTEGRCPNCGPLSLTPGRWRKVKNTSKWVPVQSGEEGDWALGNGLTYNAKLSEHYGSARFAYQEGAHGVLENGDSLLKHKRWFRWEAQVRREVATIYFIQHALARWARREAQRRAQLPPPTPPPVVAAVPVRQAA